MTTASIIRPRQPRPAKIRPDSDSRPSPRRFSDPAAEALYFPDAPELDASDTAALLAAPGTVLIDGVPTPELGLGTDGGAD